MIMKPQYFVQVKTTFEGRHRWADAPDEVTFLRNWHRHLFYVVVTVAVTHDNRDIEFFILKRKVDKIAQTIEGYKQFEYSCEQMADMFQKGLAVDGIQTASVSVHEDNENGGIVIYDYIA